MSTPAEKLTAATSYQARGWAVIQVRHTVSLDGKTCSCSRGAKCATPGKHPVVTKWQDAAMSPAKLESVWGDGAQSRPAVSKNNVGIVTGAKSGIFVLDFDPKNGGLDSFAKMKADGLVLPTRVHRTGSGGMHLFYRYVDGITNSTRGLKMPGVDVRGDGGFVVAPPSVSGVGPYTVVRDCDPAVAAPALVALLTPAPEPQAPPEPVQQAPAAPQPAQLTDRDRAYYSSAMRGELARLERMTIMQTPGGVGYQGEPWDQTCFEVACNLVEIGNATNTVEQMQAAFMAKAPVDDRFGATQHAAKWASALGKVGGQARQRSYDYSADLTAGPVVPPKAEAAFVAAAPLTAADELRIEQETIAARERLLKTPADIDFPIEKLPGALAQMVRETAAATQTPVAIAAVISLGVLSAAVGGRVEVRLKESWHEPAILWTVAAMPPASRKSAVISLLTRPLHSIERGYREKALAEAAGVESELAVLNARRKKIETGLAGGESADLRAELDQVCAQIATAELKAAPPELLMSSDITAEALRDVMASNGGRLALISSEGGQFETFAGRYSSGIPNLDLALKGHDAEPHSSSRVTSEQRDTYIGRACLSIAQVVQPNVLATAMATKVMGARGFIGRFIYAYPDQSAEGPDRVGGRAVDAPDVALATSKAWDELVCGVHGGVREFSDPAYLRLTTGSYSSLRAYREYLEPRLHYTKGEWAFMADWAGKAAGKAVRIAALLHLAGGRSVYDPIDQAEMDAGVAIMRWATSEATKVYGKGHDALSDAQRAVLLALTKHAQDKPRMTHREILHSVRNQAWCDSIEDVRAAVDDLVGLDLVTIEPRVDSAGRTLQHNPWISLIGAPTSG